MKLEYPITNFTRGLNSRAAAHLTRPDELTKADNCLIGPGYVRKRPGLTKYSTLSSTVDMLLKWRNGGTTEFLANVGTSLYKDTSGTFSAITGALSGAVKDYIQYKKRGTPPTDAAFICDGGKLKVYDGTSVAQVTAYTPTTAELNDVNLGANEFDNLSNFRSITLKGERLYGLGHPTYKNRLSFSHYDNTLGYGTPDYWPATHFIDFGTRENDEITTIETFRNKIILLGQLGVYALEGDGRTAANYKAYEIDVPSGCIASKSVVKVDNYLFYLAKDGLYALYATDQDYVSAKRLTDNLVELDSISDANKALAVGTLWNKHYLLSFPDGQTFALNLDLSSPLQNILCWSRWTGLDVKSWLDNTNMYLAKGTSIYYLNDAVDTDDGTNIVYDLETYVHLPGEVNDKKLRKLWIKGKQYDTKSSSCDVYVKVDDVQLSAIPISFDVSFILGESIMGEAFMGFQDVVTLDKSASGKGQNVHIRITNNKAEPIEIYSISVQYKPKKA